MWYQGKDIEKVREDQGRTKIEILLCQVTIEVTALAQQEKGLRRRMLEELASCQNYRD